ncbi:ABC transporter permease [Paenibacillus piri]|uniref:Transport permease protein n=1 Tax=Paenibacillus piri TaxID=2547395 RepID=A0A4R5KKW4_9BACL|nr:ABC transporter permease [Paenibacillus piri]TDF96203.1 ABC transporter permease [Paenibacillus piri]
MSNPYSPISIVVKLWENRNIIKHFTKREIVGRYRGSYLGLLWSFLNPVIMLFIYTYFFSVVLNARWDTGSDNKVEFALILFCGITTFNLFSEVVTRSPGLIVNNVNYVKKVVFPLEVLPVIALCSSFVHMIISLTILLVGLIILLGIINWTIIFIPLILIPIVLLTIGLGWFFSSLGVYLRDTSQFIGLGVQALMFLCPIFYPISIIPSNLKFIYSINPISYVVEDMRRVIIWGQYPNWEWLIIGTIIGFIISFLGYAWFQKTRGGFADVL